jgi:bifunctional non-homologous end joining protein LigD
LRECGIGITATACSIELNGDHLRRDPLAMRKATLASLVAGAASGLRLNEHLDHDDGQLVFEHAAVSGFEGIVYKRRDSPYRSSRSRGTI